MEKQYTFTLPLDQINFIMAVLGDLPTKTNAFIILGNLDSQLKEQTEAEGILNETP